MEQLQDRSVLRLVQIALAEDISTGDLTSESLVDGDQIVHATMLVKSPGVVCGTLIGGLVMGEVDRSIAIDWEVTEGDYVDEGEIIGHIRGSARTILTAERTALNFMQRMSGVATLTRRYVERVEGTGATVLDTRKTIPGWRLLDKYSVKCGGGQNHRMGLYDMVMIKDNHIAAHGSIAAAVTAVQSYFTVRGITGVPVEVETKNLTEVSEVLAIEGVDRIMFDNFTPEEMRSGVMLVDGALETEASGGITIETIRDYAETGVQFISVGALTHSAVALDISLDVQL